MWSVFRGGARDLVSGKTSPLQIPSFKQQWRGKKGCESNQDLEVIHRSHIPLPPLLSLFQRAEHTNNIDFMVLLACAFAELRVRSKLLKLSSAACARYGRHPKQISDFAPGGFQPTPPERFFGFFFASGQSLPKRLPIAQDPARNAGSRVALLLAREAGGLDCIHRIRESALDPETPETVSPRPEPALVGPHEPLEFAPVPCRVHGNPTVYGLRTPDAV